MRHAVSILTLLVISAFSFSGDAQHAPTKTDYPVQAVPLSDVDITDQFWAPKLEVNRTVSIQH